jgi:replicative DNA helicase
VQLIAAIAATERERITRISGQIRALAKDTGVPIVAVSQLNRPKDRNQNERPNKFSMKESGSLENDANTILLVFRPMDKFRHADRGGRDRNRETATRSGEQRESCLRFEDDDVSREDNRLSSPARFTLRRCREMAGLPRYRAVGSRPRRTR